MKSILEKALKATPASDAKAAAAEKSAAKSAGAKKKAVPATAIRDLLARADLSPNDKVKSIAEAAKRSGKNREFRPYKGPYTPEQVSKLAWESPPDAIALTAVAAASIPAVGNIRSKTGTAINVGVGGSGGAIDSRVANAFARLTKDEGFGNAGSRARLVNEFRDAFLNLSQAVAGVANDAKMHPSDVLSFVGSPLLAATIQVNPGVLRRFLLPEDTAAKLIEQSTTSLLDHPDRVAKTLSAIRKTSNVVGKTRLRAASRVGRFLKAVADVQPLSGIYARSGNTFDPPSRSDTTYGFAVAAIGYEVVTELDDKGNPAKRVTYAHDTVGSRVADLGAQSAEWVLRRLSACGWLYLLWSDSGALGFGSDFTPRRPLFLTGTISPRDAVANGVQKPSEPLYGFVF